MVKTKSYDIIWSVKNVIQIPYQTEHPAAQPDGKLHANPPNDKYCATLSTLLVDAADISQEAAPLNIFPNPVNDILNIHGVTSNVHIQLFDLMGRMVLEQSGGDSVDLQQVPNGAYILVVTSAQGVQTNSVLVQHWLRLNKL